MSEGSEKWERQINADDSRPLSMGRQASLILIVRAPVSFPGSRLCLADPGEDEIVTKIFRQIRQMTAHIPIHLPDLLDNGLNIIHLETRRSLIEGRPGRCAGELTSTTGPA